MHRTAMSNGKLFFDTYVAHPGSVTLVDVGAQDVNGSLREVCPASVRYIGVDFENAKGVDVVLKDPYSLPFDNGSVDVVVSSSCFEHSEMFWLVFIEGLRILKPSGIFYLNAPSNGAFHRYPVDCWRFYPDCGKALVAWARRCGINAALLESYIGHQDREIWSDFVAVFVKDAGRLHEHPNRIISSHASFENGRVYGNDEIINMVVMPEDIRRSEELRCKIDDELANYRRASFEANARCERLDQELKDRAIQISQLQAHLSKFQTQLSERIDEGLRLRRQIDSIQASICWRMTWPIRWLHKQANRIRNALPKVHLH